MDDVIVDLEFLPGRRCLERRTNLGFMLHSEAFWCPGLT
jgi:hypothetical protein